MWWAIGIIFLVVMWASIIATIKQTPEQKTIAMYGTINPAMVCPHCKATGHIRTKSLSVKKGLSGGKVTAAVLTAGISILATGLSRKQAGTQAYCERCNNTWFF